MSRLTKVGASSSLAGRLRLCNRAVRRPAAVRFGDRIEADILAGWSDETGRRADNALAIGPLHAARTVIHFAIPEF